MSILAVSLLYLKTGILRAFQLETDHSLFWCCETQRMSAHSKGARNSVQLKDHRRATWTIILQNCSITVHCLAVNRAHCKWFSIGFIPYLLQALRLYECHQKTQCHKRPLCKTADAVFSTLWNILMTLSVRGAGSSHRDPVLESMGTDLNNPPFSRSPGCFHAHLLTSGTRSRCPFSTNTLTTPTTASTLTETHTLHYTQCDS